MKATAAELAAAVTLRSALFPFAIYQHGVISADINRNLISNCKYRRRSATTTPNYNHHRNTNDDILKYTAATTTTTRSSATS